MLAVVILSVRPSVWQTLALSQKIQCTADLLMPHERAITLLFWYQQWLAGTPPSAWNLRSKWSATFEKRRLRQISAYNVSTVRDSEKRFNYDEEEVDRPRVFQREIGLDDVRMLPLSPSKGRLKKRFFVFFSRIQFQSNKVCYKVFVWKLLAAKLYSITIPLSDGSRILAWKVTVQPNI